MTRYSIENLTIHRQCMKLYFSISSLPKEVINYLEKEEQLLEIIEKMNFKIMKKIEYLQFK